MTEPSTENLNDPLADEITEEIPGTGINQNTRKKPVLTRRRFSFKEKLKILQQLENNSMMTVCKNFHVNEFTVRKWKKQRELIEKNCKDRKLCNTKKKIIVGNPDVDDALHKWYLKARRKRLPISGPILKSEALRLNDELGGKKDFVASDGWLDNWKRRKGIKSLMFGYKNPNLSKQTCSVCKTNLKKEQKMGKINCIESISKEKDHQQT
ncbi:major centromere autoantigen B-like isoform X1 [Cotesia typhae]|uniref:major centromere autoantigen B-like isoform X1 n=1 Tax=Cotesia typhae TaxID=2053667 RepID=UPI003D68A548